MVQESPKEIVHIIKTVKLSNEDNFQGKNKNRKFIIKDDFYPQKLTK